MNVFRQALEHFGLTDRRNLLIPSAAFVVLTAVMVALNLDCGLCFPVPRATCTLRFSFGFPFPYLRGDVPGPGTVFHRHPERAPPGVKLDYLPTAVWGWSEMNDAESMQRIRDEELADLSLTVWGLFEYGEFHPLGLMLNGVIVLSVWPLLLWVCCAVRAEFEKQRHVRKLAVGQRVRLRGVGSEPQVGIIEELDQELARLTVRIDLPGQTICLDVAADEVVRDE